MVHVEVLTVSTPDSESHAVPWSKCVRSRKKLKATPATKGEVNSSMFLRLLTKPAFATFLDSFTTVIYDEDEDESESDFPSAKYLGMGRMSL